MMSSNNSKARSILANNMSLIESVEKPTFAGGVSLKYYAYDKDWYFPNRKLRGKKKRGPLDLGILSVNHNGILNEVTIILRGAFTMHGKYIIGSEGFTYIYPMVLFHSALIHI